MSMDQIEQQAERFAECREQLSQTCAQMHAEMNKVKAHYLSDMRRWAAAAHLERDHLYNAIEASPELFKKPKTKILHGIKCGYRKMPGQVKFDDEETVINRITKALPNQAAALIKTKRTLDKTALQKLSAAELKKLGVSIVDVDDTMIAKPVDDEFQKVIDALLAENDDTPEVLL